MKKIYDLKEIIIFIIIIHFFTYFFSFSLFIFSSLVLGKSVSFKAFNRILIRLIPPLECSNNGLDFKQNKTNFLYKGWELEGNSFSIWSICSPHVFTFSPK